MTRALIVLVASVFALSACERTASQDVKPQASEVTKDSERSSARKFNAKLELDAIIGFSDVEYCVPNPTFEKLLDGFMPTGQLGELIEPYRPDFPAGYESAFGKAEVAKDGYTGIAKVGLSGSWQTLPLSELEVWKTPESDYEGFAITFDTTFQETIEKLNNLGFNLPSSGQREVGDELVSYVRLDSKAGKTTLTCSTG